MYILKYTKTEAGYALSLDAFLSNNKLIWNQNTALSMKPSDKTKSEPVNADFGIMQKMNQPD